MYPYEKYLNENINDKVISIGCARQFRQVTSVYFFVLCISCIKL